LSKDPNVDCTHQLLPEDVKAVSWVCVSIDRFLLNVITVLESALSFAGIVLITDEAVQLMKTFHICNESATIFGRYLDLIVCDASSASGFCWDDYAPICASVSIGATIQDAWTVLQSIPSACHASSTSSLAFCLYMFSLSREPLNCCSWNASVTSGMSGDLCSTFAI
ncbi:hypothetical protein KCU64_g105, partial [Aureobasidium melanogenum]